MMFTDYLQLTIGKKSPKQMAYNTFYIKKGLPEGSPFNNNVVDADKSTA